MKLLCDCGTEPKTVEKLSKFVGPQMDKMRVGVFHLYQCPKCKNKYWDFIPDY